MLKEFNLTISKINYKKDKNRSSVETFLSDSKEVSIEKTHKNTTPIKKRPRINTVSLKKDNNSKFYKQNSSLIESDSVKLNSVPSIKPILKSKSKKKQIPGNNIAKKVRFTDELPESKIKEIRFVVSFKKYNQETIDYFNTQSEDNTTNAKQRCKCCSIY